MTQKGLIEQAKEKQREVIDGLHIISPNGKCIQCAKEALALLDQYQDEQAAKGMDEMGFKKAEPPEGEFTKEFRRMLDENRRTWPIWDCVYDTGIEACDRLDAQQQEIEKLKDDQKYLEQCLADKRKLTKEISDILHPDGNGPEQPSLCDVVKYVRDDFLKSRASIQAQDERIEKLIEWIKDLQSGMYINCVYCGHRYGPKKNTPVAMADILKQHIEQCPDHPMSKLRVENKAQAERIDKMEEAICRCLVAWGTDSSQEREWLEQALKD